MAGKRKYSINENSFEKLTPECAYWLGFIAADGCIRENTRNIKTFGFSLHKKDKKHLQKFQKFINSNHPIFENKKKPSINLWISSEKIYNDLLSYGIKPLKTYSTQSHISNIPDEYKKYFISGIFDGDGSFIVRNKKVYDKKYGRSYSYEQCTIRILSNIKTLEDIIKYMNKEWNIDYPKICKTHSKYAYTISLYSDKNIRNFYKLYKETPVCLERKLYKIEEFLSKKDKFVDKRFG